jgi:hypothetical protein
LPGQIFLPGPPLLNAMQAEIHAVIKYHGPVVPAILVKQISTGYGGCTGGPGQPPDPVPAHQIYPCWDPQATGFPGL